MQLNIYNYDFVFKLYEVQSLWFFIEHHDISFWTPLEKKYDFERLPINLFKDLPT